ncbi:MAG TPA: folylpolyglutamate synthase/dihydrofolate synthase family protein, partial [Chloroflexota bacterium]|nr:folylpolyglutamate synthase/dihydrofolate synthase family protein [Chloroflexota bacterium]
EETVKRQDGGDGLQRPRRRQGTGVWQSFSPDGTIHRLDPMHRRTVSSDTTVRHRKFQTSMDCQKSVMDYQEALDWIMSYWEPGRPKSQEKALRPLKVPRMRVLLSRLGSPQLAFPSILVAGTKGKGSTAAFIAEGLRAAGYRVGRYTQPHLIDWRERTWVDGRIIEPDEVARLAERIRPVVDDLNRDMVDLGTITTYEVGTALTLCYFAERKVDVAVLEIGVGGRLDALNAVEPILSAITSISLDHTDVLGDSLDEIATEKAGILRYRRPAVVASQRPEAEDAIRRVATEKGAHLSTVGRDWRWVEGTDAGTVDIFGPRGELKGLRVALLGDHQRDNATTAVAALQLLREQGFGVGDDAIRRGLAEVEWPGRIQRLRRSPYLVADAAHNVDSVSRLLETVRKEFSFVRLILVFGASGDKNVEGMARVLGPAASRVVVTSSGHRRAADVERLAGVFAHFGEVVAEPDPEAAFEVALGLAAPEDLVLVTGSVFLAGRAVAVFQ